MRTCESCNARACVCACCFVAFCASGVRKVVPTRVRDKERWSNGEANLAVKKFVVKFENAVPSLFSKRQFHFLSRI